MTNYELYISTIKTLASSQGFYSRMLRDFNEMSDAGKKRLEKELNSYPQIKDTVDMCMFLEGGLDLQPQTKYGKKILKVRGLMINNQEYLCYVLDDGGEYYDIHVVDDKFRDEEANTLKLQEPKDCVELERVTSKAFMFAQIAEHALWDLCYGDNGKHYDFSIDYEESDLD